MRVGVALPRCGEAGEMLTDIDMTLKTLNPNQNELFILEHGSAVPKASNGLERHAGARVRVST